MVNPLITQLPYDLNALRSDFPILHQAHSDGIPLIFLDNAASSQRPIQVIEAVNDYYRRYHANVHRGIYKLSEAATVAYEEARIKVRRFINARSRREVIFTRGTTESINLVAQAWGRANLGPGDTVICTQMEHHSNIVPWQLLAAEKGFDLRYVPILDDGTLDLVSYEALLKKHKVRLVTFVHTSNVLGTMNPAKWVIDRAHEYGALVVLDGAQSVPHMPVDVQALDVDFLAFSGHKMIGPTGIGVLYGKRDLLEVMPPWMGGGDMIETVSLDGSTWNELPYKFEAGTPAIAQAIGLGVAIDYLTGIGMDKIHVYEQMITNYALEKLAEISGVKVFGPDNNRGAVVAFTCDRIHAHDIAQFLDADGVAVRAGHHCAQPLHQRFGISATARASFYLYNTFQEVDALTMAIYKVKQVFSR